MLKPGFFFEGIWVPAHGHRRPAWGNFAIVSLDMVLSCTKDAGRQPVKGKRYSCAQYLV